MNYLPLLTLVLTAAGGALALWQVEGPPRARVVSVFDHAPLQTRLGLTAFGLRPVTTPDAGPALFPDLCPSPFELPAPPRALARAAWRADVARFGSPPAPVFTLQTPTPTTGETKAVA